MKLRSEFRFQIKLFQYPLVLDVIFTKNVENGYLGLTTYDDITGVITMHINTSSRLVFTINSAIIHELLHVKQYVEQHICGNLDIESEAYFVEELYDQIIVKYFGIAFVRNAQRYFEVNIIDEREKPKGREALG